MVPHQIIGNHHFHHLRGVCRARVPRAGWKVFQYLLHLRRLYLGVRPIAHLAIRNLTGIEEERDERSPWVDTMTLEKGCESPQRPCKAEVGFVGYITDLYPIETRRPSLGAQASGQRSRIDAVEDESDLGNGVLESMAESLYDGADVEVQQSIHVILCVSIGMEDRKRRWHWPAVTRVRRVHLKLCAVVLIKE